MCACLSTLSKYELCTTHDVCMVIPYRKSNINQVRLPTLLVVG